MAATKAAGPKLSLADLIDQHLKLDAEIKAKEAEKKATAEQIFKLMDAKKLRSALGNSGEGYRKSSWMQCDFKPDALEYIRRINKTHLFVPEPLITKARLRSAFEGGHLSAVQVEKIQKFAGPDYPVHRLYKISREEGEQS